MADKKEKKQHTPVELPSLETFLKAGSHFGHNTSRWHPKMDRYIYTERNNIHIIDLVQTMGLLQDALEVMQKAADHGSILIVGTKGQAASLIQNVAENVGAFYINNRWPGGLFTNFDMIKKSVNRLVDNEEHLAGGAEELTKKEQLLLKREVDRYNRLYEGIKFMDRLPKLMVVIDSRVEENAIREAREVGIPVVSIVDTNCNPALIDYPIPANDDSIASITLFTELFEQAIKGGKRADAIISLRNSHEAKLKSLRKEHEIEVAKREKEKEKEMNRLQKLKDGKVSAKTLEEKNEENTEKKGNVVRVANTEPKKEDKGKKLEDTDIGTRAINSLEDAGYEYVSEIKSMTKSQLTNIKGIGDKTADEIKDIVDKG